MRQTGEQSQHLFELVVKSVEEMRNAALGREDWQTYRDANRVYTLVCKCFGSLMAEGPTAANSERN